MWLNFYQSHVCPLHVAADDSLLAHEMQMKERNRKFQWKIIVFIVELCWQFAFHCLSPMSVCVCVILWSMLMLAGSNCGLPSEYGTANQIGVLAERTIVELKFVGFQSSRVFCKRTKHQRYLFHVREKFDDMLFNSLVTCTRSYIYELKGTYFDGARIESLWLHTARCWRGTMARKMAFMCWQQI